MVVLLPKNQFNFRNGVDTIDALTALITDIQINFSFNNYFGCVFIDLSDVYNCVDLWILGDKLIRLSAPKQFAYNVTRLFKNRSIYTVI